MGVQKPRTETPSLGRALSTHARIRWRCRRGMRELDLLLERFVSSALDELDEPDLRRFEALLDEPDQDILDWLWGARRPADPDTARIVAIVKRHLGPVGPRDD